MENALPMVIKLVLAALFGGIVGYEREVHEHPAGLRTHVLVCLGSALITLVSMSFAPPKSDPSRIAAQIVSGIGFLGAGTILRQGSIVRGLTTAASLWTVAGIGMAVAVGGTVFYILAAVSTLIVFLTLSTMRTFEPGQGKRTVRQIRLQIPAGQDQILAGVLQELIEMRIGVESVHCADSHEEGKRAFTLGIALPRRVTSEMVVQRLAGYPGVERFDWS